MILGIDPGLANVGWAVVARDRGETEAKLVDWGCIESKSGERMEKRLCLIYEALEKIIDKFGVKEMAVESLFFARNVKSAMKVSEALGVIKLCGAKKGIEVFDYTPLQIKMTLVGYGQAEKEQVELMVRHFLGLEEKIEVTHGSDAAAAALTHLFTNRDLLG